MEEFSYTHEYLTKNGRPWLPIMGEFHFSRYPKRYWKESIEKIKAGGVSIIATYVIWIHHEEVQGEIDWTGSNDIGAFLELCREAGLYVFLRPGPWCHAEVRNGGFPDWLQHGPYKLRSNDPAYLAQVRRFWSSLYRQVAPYLYKNGGPIIGMQIENEYGAVGGDGGDNHIRALSALADEIGFEVPYRTATCWGNAATGDLMPVQGGYCEAPWDRELGELAPNINYVFSGRREGSGLTLDEHLNYDPARYPFLTAELGGGLQVTYNRRPRVRSRDTGAMSLVKLGSGANLLGYYVYHGGTNPVGKNSPFQESKSTGSYCDLPELSYDFQAPIREYGQIANAYKEIRMLGLFLSDFGEELAAMAPVIPEDSPIDPANTADLRTAIRMKDGRGYLFVNNYQRRMRMDEHPNCTLKAGDVTFPPIDIHNGDYFFLPFHMRLNDETELVSATATPLCRIGDAFVFYAECDPRYELKGAPARILTLSREEARNACRVVTDQQHLVLCDQSVVRTEEGLTVYAREDAVLRVWPQFPGLDGEKDGEFTRYLLPVPKSNLTVQTRLLRETCLYQEFILTLSGDVAGNDVFLRIDYEGNQAELFVDDTKIADDYYRNSVWEVGLKRFNFPKTLRLRIFALEEGAPVFLERRPEMHDYRAMRLNGVRVEEETKLLLPL